MSEERRPGDEQLAIHARARHARRLRVRGIVQGVGFRPFVYRLAHQHRLAGWVLNGTNGVEIHIEGERQALDDFQSDLESHPPPAARIVRVDVREVSPAGLASFSIRESETFEPPTVRLTPDLAICSACLAELFDPSDRRFHYPYINCTDCGPRYSIIESLPYDRPRTTMNAWTMCPACAREYHDPFDRRFHAQPVACPHCGPDYLFETSGEAPSRGEAALQRAARWLQQGKILAIKGIGGYHLSCDARDEMAVQRLRERKIRQEKPFALMARDLRSICQVIAVDAIGERLLLSPARPILLAPAVTSLPGVAPDNRDLGVMLPYTPVHHLLFGFGAPDVLVMTSANRSDEPIAFDDADARTRLAGIADAFLVGERAIARRVDDSIARVSPVGPVIWRRARGFAPAVVATLPTRRPILAVGADLKGAVTLVVGGEALVSQHLGDLDHLAAFQAFTATVDDLRALYAISPDSLLVVHDLHPGYASTRFAREQPGRRLAIQHHRAHIASVLAEREAWETEVIGFAFDGTGYGDDETIWGGEIFVGSLRRGFQRVGHLRAADLPGGDASARFPVQAAAGFLAQLPDLPDLRAAPFDFPDRYIQAARLVERRIRSFRTTSMGRLFDTAAALLGFTRPMTFEGQAAIWLEHLARGSPVVPPYPLPWANGELDFRPLLAALARDRQRGCDVSHIARAFHESIARAIVDVSRQLEQSTGLRHVVLSGGVFQNMLLLSRVYELFAEDPGWTVWINQLVPPNDGGISLGQAALGAFALLAEDGPSTTIDSACR